MICITYQKLVGKGLTFASFFYFAPGDMNPSFTPTKDIEIFEAARVANAVIMTKANCPQTRSLGLLHSKPAYAGSIQSALAKRAVASADFGFGRAIENR